MIPIGKVTLSEPRRAVRLESGISMWSPRHGPPRQLERLPAPFSRHLSGSALSGHVGIRKGLLQPAQPEDRPPYQVRQSGRRYRRGGRQRRHRQGLQGRHRHLHRGDKGRARERCAGIDPDDRDRRVRRPQRDRPEVSHSTLLPGAGWKVGHDAFAVLRETIREMNKVAIGRVVLTNREHIIALEPMDRGLMGTLLRYPYEVRSADEYFDDIQDVKVTKDMLDLAKHIVNQKAGHFEPNKFEDQYETALVDLINQKRSGEPIVPKERPRGENVVDLMDALRKSIGGAEAAKDAKPAKKPRKVASGQKEMLMPIAGKKAGKEAASKKPAKPQRKSA